MTERSNIMKNLMKLLVNAFAIIGEANRYNDGLL